MSAVDLLKSAKAKLEKGWCQGAGARDSDGCSVAMSGPNAVCWCLSGAMWATIAASPGEYGDKAEDAAWLALQRTVGISIVDWNDAPFREKSEVLKVMDLAIEKAGAA
jgi:hypothetical protein